ncbi:MAG: ferritin-like domain-containing protein [Candidatus Bathyarchaeia archaeon]
MSIDEEWIKLVKHQIEVENVNVKEVAESEKKVGNAAAKLYLRIIRMDSQKHAEVLSGLLDFIGKVPSSENLWTHKLESYVDPFVVKKELERHMEREMQMIQHVKKEIRKTKDEALKTLLRYIVEEEKKHHKMIETILKNTT